MSAVGSKSPAYVNEGDGLREDRLQHHLMSFPTSSGHYDPMMQSHSPFVQEPNSMNELESFPIDGPGYDADHSTGDGSYSSVYPSNNTNNSMNGLPYQQNGFLSHQDFSHSASHSLNASPNAMNEQIGTEGYLSDPAPQYSSFTGPYDDQLFGDQFGSMLHLDDPQQTTSFPPYHEQQVPLSFDTSDSGSHLPPQRSTHGGLPMSNQLLTPSVSNTSSPCAQPVIGMCNAVPPAKDFAPYLSTTTLGHQQQQSPALTSSSAVSLGQPQAIANHLPSPIVRVENYSSEESPISATNPEIVPKRALASKRSASLLSPYGADVSSDEELAEESENSWRSFPAQERNDDGSWKLRNGHKQGGVSPSDRTDMKRTEIPSLEQQEESRLLAEKKAEVEDWLSHSDVGSEAEGDPDKLAGRSRRRNRRRAKSHNDMNPRINTEVLGLGFQAPLFDDSLIPGPGRYLEERSEIDEYGDESNFSEDGSEDSERSLSPPAPVDVYRRPGTVPFPRVDSMAYERVAPPTANAAMMRFYMRAKENDSASVTATLGSRRLSESDIGSILHAGGISRQIAPETIRKAQEKRQRRPSFLEQILPKRNSSNLLKRKGSHPPPAEPGQASPKEASGTATPLKPTHSWSRSLSRVDTNLSVGSKDGISDNPSRPISPAGPFSAARKALHRHRSKSDLGKAPGLAQLMTRHGGPPVPYLASPSVDAENAKSNPPPVSNFIPKDENLSDEEDEMTHDTVVMDLKVRTDPIIPTMEGFRTHARQLNPRLENFMVERVAQEQMRRYKRLLEHRVKHINAVKNKSCHSGKSCIDLGGEPKLLPPRGNNNRDGDTPFIGFQVTAPGASDEEEAEAISEGTVVSAQFPTGVPTPPVKRLPAEFECPLCFRVKKFYKPSDWTKHVHEDTTPFTCTFPGCGEPKSFKRKADWVRHENERHRQLEFWTCSLDDCAHVCYRKDNFVQHLVREHKLQEPKPRPGRTTKETASAQSSGDPSDRVWALVEQCRHDTTKQPKEEPCRFCGNICNSWKKLSVHLAKHMEQISMPTLSLVKQKQLNADTIISPVDFPSNRDQLLTPLRSPASSNLSRYSPGTGRPSHNTGFDQHFGAPMSKSISPAGSTSDAMHTYPPPTASFDPRQQSGASNANFGYRSQDPAQSFPVRSYPPVSHPQGYENTDTLPSFDGNRANIQNRGQGIIAPITPVSGFDADSQMFTSPVDTVAFQPEGFSSFSQSIPASGEGGMPIFADADYNQYPHNNQYHPMNQYGYNNR